MKILMLLALLPMIAMADSSTYFEIGAGKNGNLTGSSHEWYDNGGTGAYFAFRTEWDNGFFVQYSHYSQYEVGQPFNDKGESSLDHIGFGLRIKIR